MPRIPPSTIRQAHRISPHAAALLPVCRDLSSSLNELRWVREHVRQSAPHASASPWAEELQVASLCRRRGRGEPLQYVLGTQPFGGLELKCRPGVFIPRPEPEAYTTHLAALIQHSHLLGPSPQLASLSILDLCTGTGCIALLLCSLLAHTIPNLHVHGIDISPHAVNLSEENARHNDIASGSLVFTQADIFSDDALLGALASSSPSCGDSPPPPSLDVLVCNPPYVSGWGYTRQTAKSVRRYEPKIAQVPMVLYPGDHLAEDVFYARLLDIAARLRPRVMLYEVGDLGQALRVVEMALQHEGFAGTSGTGKVDVEVWRDWPDAAPGESEETSAVVRGGTKKVRIKGSGHGRSVFIQCR